jgi:hypothetical protein
LCASTNDEDERTPITPENAGIQNITNKIAATIFAKELFCGGAQAAAKCD